MRDLTHECILDHLVNEYQVEGHEVIEVESVHYARIVLPTETGAVVASEVNLTRIADAIIRRLS